MLVGILAIGLMFLPSHMYNNPSRFPKSDSMDEITPEQQLKASEVLSGSQRDIILNSYSIFEPVPIIVLYGCSFHREIVGDELYTALVTAWTIGSVLARVNWWKDGRVCADWMGSPIMAQIHFITTEIFFGASFAPPFLNIIISLFNIINPHEESRLLKFLKFPDFYFRFFDDGNSDTQSSWDQNCA
jgi:hypothetical protein